MTITADKVKFYQENGFVVLKDIYTEQEIDEIAQELDTLFERKSQENNLEATWVGEWKNGHKEQKEMSVHSIHNVNFFSSVFTQMLHKKRFVQAISEATGMKDILLHHTKAHVKPAGIGAPFPSHQDYHYFPFKKHSVVTAVLHLDDANEKNGGLALFPGSHKLGPLKDTAIQNGDFKYHYVDQNAFPLDKATQLDLKRGDVLVFSYLMVHCSGPNRSGDPRRIILTQMMSAEDEPAEDRHKSPAQGIVLLGRNFERDADIEKRAKDNS